MPPASSWFSHSSADWAIILAWGAGGALLWSKRPVAKAKKPLVMTPRATRLFYTGLAVCADTVAFPAALGLLAGSRVSIGLGIIGAFVACAGAGYMLAVANLVLYPSEATSRRRFEVIASKRLSERRPRIVAITGSAGKTTTKELVAHLLSGRFRVLKTPSSFNTPMGIARTINDSFRDQDVFVVEMGAYEKGEIARLCKLVGGTDVSVITTVNAQHLERFGSLEKTAEAKWEIVEGLRPSGIAVLNFDVPAVRDRAATLKDHDVFSFGVESLDADLRGSNVVETPDGIEFDVTHEGETVSVKSPLLARHNAGNILAAISVGLSFGLDLGYMAAAVRQFRAPEHRLQPQHLANGVVVLDDGYNGNPEGIVGALEVLGGYAPKQRIVVTPGLIEMGSEKSTYHAAIGRAAAQAPSMSRCWSGRVRPPTSKQPCSPPTSPRADSRHEQLRRGAGAGRVDGDARHRDPLRQRPAGPVRRVAADLTRRGSVSASVVANLPAVPRVPRQSDCQGELGSATGST